jgi:hypothetical protein
VRVLAAAVWCAMAWLLTCRRAEVRWLSASAGGGGVVRDGVAADVPVC